MGGPAADALEEKAALLRDALRKSSANTERIVSIIGSFDRRLSALDVAMRPAQDNTFAIVLAHDNIHKTLKSSDVILSQFDRAREAENKIMKGPHEDLEGYLLAVDQLRGVLRFFNSKKNFRSNEGVLSHVINLLGKAIVKLEVEFRELLLNCSFSTPMNFGSPVHSIPNSQQPSASPGIPDENGNSISGTEHSGNQTKTLQTAAYTSPTLITPRILPLLRRLAQQLVQAGHQQQCSKIYKEARVLALEKSLSSSGVQKLSQEEVQKLPWESLEAQINNWSDSMRITVKLLFAGERQLCDQIFEGVGSLKDCFAEVTVNRMMMLLNFGEAIISSSKRSPEKLFVLLDMYEVMHELQPEMETIFEGKSCLEIREAILSLTRRLAQTAQGTLGDFVDVVEKDATKTIVFDGTVHPLTSYVINYVKFLFDYRTTLKQLFLELEPAGGTISNVTSVTMEIIQALLTNLDAKSKQYKDQAMSHLFLMNNIHYIVKSVRRSEGKDLVGDDWIQRHRRIVQQNANQYKRIAWQKILQTLSAQGLTSSGGSSMPGSDGGNNSGVSRAAVKDRFRSFTSQFEDIIQRQNEWAVPDQELRESLILAVAEVLLPAYRSFIKRFGQYLDNQQKYIRYTAEEVEQKLNFLFEVKPSSESKR